MKVEQLIYLDYYSTPDTREICHAVKQDLDPKLKQHAIETITSAILASKILSNTDDPTYLIPAPQHTGNATYTKKNRRNNSQPNKHTSTRHRKEKTRYIPIRTKTKRANNQNTNVLPKRNIPEKRKTNTHRQCNIKRIYIQSNKQIVRSKSNTYRIRSRLHNSQRHHHAKTHRKSTTRNPRQSKQNKTKTEKSKTTEKEINKKEIKDKFALAYVNLLEKLDDRTDLHITENLENENTTSYIITHRYTTKEWEQILEAHFTTEKNHTKSPTRNKRRLHFP